MWIFASIAITLGLFVMLGFDSGTWIGINKKQWFALVGVLLLLVPMVSVVPANSVGILYSPFGGGVQESTYGEGIHIKSPLDTMYTISTEVQTKTIKGLVGQTKDSQFLTMTVDVKYFVDGSKASDVFSKFKTLDNVDYNLIMPATQRAIEEITTQYNVIGALGSDRSAIYNGIETFLGTRFSADGITLHSITFLDTDAGDSIEAAIQDEAVAKKAVETAIQQRIKAETDAETRIIQATAEAEEKKILALALAESPAVLELEWIKKWDGVLPQFMSGESDGVMIDLTDK